jgi:hypothetical protein
MFTRSAAAAVVVSSNSSNYVLNLVSPAALNITTGPANNTFTATESGANKVGTVSITSVPTGFTIGASCTMTSN